MLVDANIVVINNNILNNSIVIIVDVILKCCYVSFYKLYVCVNAFNDLLL